jgi:hypothetical protein
MCRASTKRLLTRRSNASPDHAVGETQLCAAPAAQEAFRAAGSARLVPVALTLQEEEYLPAPAAREDQTPAYLYLGCAHNDVPL